MKKGSWPKPSMELNELLDKHVSRFDADKRQTFGFPCYFVNGNMFVGTFSNVLFARFSVQDRESLDKGRLGSDFEPVKGHKMTDYRVLSKEVLEVPNVLDAWLDRSYAYVTSLKPKKKS